MRFSTAVNILLLSVATVVSALPIAQYTSSLELESRGSYTASIDITSSHWDSDDFDAPDIFKRASDFDEPALCKLEACQCLQFMTDLVIIYRPTHKIPRRPPSIGSGHA
jgi:hypothetical protein